MITTTSLRNPTVLARIHAAMVLATRQARESHTIRAMSSGMFDVSIRSFGATVYVKNRKGNAYIRVDYLAYGKATQSGFRFYLAGSCADRTATVLEVLRERETAMPEEYDARVASYADWFLNQPTF